MEVRLSSKRYEEIKRAATRMLVENGISRVPVSGFEIARKLGIKVMPYSAYPPWKRSLMLGLSEDGFAAEAEAGKMSIFYNDEKGYGRINNTLMHEIGHIVLDHSEDSELAEKEVKFFAKYALVPPALVHGLGIKEPWEIADTFRVSNTAAIYALNYYRKWLEFGKPFFTPYEMRQLEQFGMQPEGRFGDECL